MAITTGSPRGSLARIPQKAEVFKLEKSVFDTLMQEIPEFANSLLTVMSKRLEDRLRKQRIAARYQHLSGDLQYFDLDTLIQAIAGSGRSGTFAICQSSGSIRSSLHPRRQGLRRMPVQAPGRHRTQLLFYPLDRDP